jgi:FkbM family methyltransferase
MDLGRLATYGRSPTWTAWVTNPIRRVLWWLVAPYFRGAGVEIDRHVGHVTAEIDNRMRGFVADINEKMRAAIASQLGGVRKDAMAVAHRLAGLEEEAATLTNLSAHVTEIGANVMAVAHRLAGLEEEAATVAQARDAVAERITNLSAHVTKTGANVAALQQDVRAYIQQVNERIDLLARGSPLRWGALIPVGQGDLVIAVSPTGTHFLVRQHDLIGRLISDGREWEPHVRTAIERAARPDGIAVDIGAYIGVHTITMSRCFRTVHAFEPQKGIFQILCGNLALNGGLNVIAYNEALYDRAGSMRLAPQERQEVPIPLCDGQPDYDHIGNAAALSFDFVADGGGDVPAIALDDRALENIALIKVDAQGADLRVLRGAEETIRRCLPIVLFEWERDLALQHGAVLDDYHAFFDGLGYAVATLQETTPGRQADYIARPRG